MISEVFLSESDQGNEHLVFMYEHYIHQPVHQDNIPQITNMFDCLMKCRITSSYDCKEASFNEVADFCHTGPDDINSHVDTYYVYNVALTAASFHRFRKITLHSKKKACFLLTSFIKFICLIQI